MINFYEFEKILNESKKSEFDPDKVVLPPPPYKVNKKEEKAKLSSKVNGGKDNKTVNKYEDDDGKNKIKCRCECKACLKGSCKDCSCKDCKCSGCGCKGAMKIYKNK